jgi:hypothetical protein
MFGERQGFHVRRMEKFTSNTDFFSFLHSILVVFHVFNLLKGRGHGRRAIDDHQTS